jgi:ribosomal protein S12 methylthiotransferase
VPAHGIKLTPKHYAYLKISEGCNHRCTFCIIPSMRGDLVSRPVGDVMKEAESLVKSGVKELLVISQDTSAYGVDVKYRTGFWGGKPLRTRMTELCQALGELGVWVRLHYVYPYPHVDEVIPLMAAGKILPYLDVPFQHASPRILKLMKRPASSRRTSSASARGARRAPTSPSARPSSPASRARPRPSSRSCWLSCARRSSTASAASPTRRSRARRPTTCRAPCRKR